MTNIENLQAKTEDESSPILHILRAVDDLAKNAIPYQQALMYAENLAPEYLEGAYKTKLLIAKTYSTVHNIATLNSENNGIFSLRLANYNMEYFLTSAVNEIKKMYDNRNNEIILSCTKDCKSIVLDIRRTSTILFNLISNAVVHGGNKDKSIYISASIKGNNFVLSVRDNGKGIAKSERENLFSAYKNKLSPKKIKETGGGLFTSGTGLAVSKKAADEMGGTLNYIPSSPGSLFELSIPQNIQRSTFHSTLEYAIGRSEIEEYLAASILTLKFDE